VRERPRCARKAEQPALAFVQRLTSSGGLAYNQYQSAQPQTLAYAHATTPQEPTTTPTGVAIFGLASAGLLIARLLG
jgi:hypothetical protein